MLFYVGSGFVLLEDLRLNEGVGGEAHLHPPETSLSHTRPTQQVSARERHRTHNDTVSEGAERKESRGGGGAYVRGWQEDARERDHVPWAALAGDLPTEDDRDLPRRVADWHLKWG